MLTADQLRTIHEAIVEHLPAVLTARAHDDSDAAFRTLFLAAFRATARAFSAAGMIRDSVERSHLLRLGIPLKACWLVSAILDRETLGSGLFRLRALRSVEMLRGCVDHTYPVERIDGDESLRGVVRELEADLLAEVLRLELAVVPADSVSDSAGNLARAREARLQLRLEFARLESMPMSFASIQSEARVDRKYFRLWRRGELPESSVMSERIEKVLMLRAIDFTPGVKSVPPIACPPV